MPETKDGVLMILVKAFAAAAPAFVLLYLTDDGFKAQVDGALIHVRYQWRLARWRNWWHGLHGWEQEAFESKHGPQESV